MEMFPGVIAPQSPLASYRWSSYPLYLQPPTGRPGWLRTGRLFGEWGIPQDSDAGRMEFAAAMELRRHSDTEEEFKPLQRGWCLGSEAFRQELLAQVAARPGDWHYGEPVPAPAS